MAEQFPRSNLNPSAAPWGRAVEREVREALRRLGRLEGSLDGTQVAAIAGLRKQGADPTIYRPSGIVSATGAMPEAEFTIYAGPTTQDTDGGFSSLSLGALRTVLRSTRDNLRTAFINLGYAENNDNGIVIGFGNGVRADDFLDQIQVLAAYVFEDRPYITLGRWFESDALHIGWEPDTFESSPNGPQIVHHPYLQFGTDADEDRVYSFAGLKAATRPATVDQTGYVQLATDAQTINGQREDRAVTPHGLKAALAAQGGGSGGKGIADYYRGAWAAA